MHKLMYFDLDKISEKDSEEFQFLSAIEFLMFHDEINVTINDLTSDQLLQSKDEELRTLVIDTVNALREYYSMPVEKKVKKTVLKRIRIIRKYGI